jgi:hypothetical protein
MGLVATSGDPVKKIWPTIEALVAYVKTFDPNVSAASLQAFYDLPSHVLLEGQQAFFSGIPFGVQTCSGDSGGPILRVGPGGALTIVGVNSSTFSSSAFPCWGGAYYGLVASAETQTLVATALADRCRAVSLRGYCNADTAIRCAPPEESSLPIAMADCGALGLACAIDADGAATCTDPKAPGPTPACSLVGKWNHPRNALYELKADGTYLVRNAPRGAYAVAGSVVTFEDTVGPCVGAPGEYDVVFDADCTKVTFTVRRDGCRLRAEGMSALAFTAVP